MGRGNRDEERSMSLQSLEDEEGHDDDDDDGHDHQNDHDPVRAAGRGPEEEDISPDEQRTPRTPSLRATTAALCLGMLTHSYLLISVFPYSGFLAMHLLDLDETAASQYAGFLASSFMAGRAVTSLAWGRAADWYGRTTVLYTSLLLQCLFSLAFGLVRRSFAAALVVRFLLGCSNGIMGTIKTIVSEISTKEEEARTMTFVIGMWGWGFLASPAVAGALAEPIRQYPNVEWIQQQDVLRRWPFLLPNLLGAALCMIAFVLIKLFVRETLPVHDRRSFIADVRRWWDRRCRRQRHLYRPVLKMHESDSNLGYEDDDGDCVYDDTYDDGNNGKSVTSMASLMSRLETRKCLTVYWLYSFVGLTVDESFPLFCLSHEAGFGLPEKEIGKILSLCGLIFAVCQYCIYNSVYSRCGLYGSIKVGLSLSAPLLCLVPLSLLLNRGMEMGELRWSTFVFLAGLLALYRCFALVFFSSISIATNRTVPVSDRASMNGLSVLGGSVAKALGPSFAGLLTTLSVRWLGSFASLLVFGSVSILGLSVLTLSLFFLHDEEAAAASVVDDDGEQKPIVQKSIELLSQGKLVQKILK